MGLLDLLSEKRKFVMEIGNSIKVPEKEFVENVRRLSENYGYAIDFVNRDSVNYKFYMRRVKNA